MQEVSNFDTAAGLSSEELEAICEVLNSALNHIRPDYCCGVFVFTGQPYGDVEEDLVISKLYGSQAAALPEAQSEALIQKAYDLAKLGVDKLIAYPNTDLMHPENWNKGKIEVDGVEYPRTAVYHDDQLMVLVLNARSGRFILSVQIAGTDGVFDLKASALAIGVLADAFTQLQISADDSVLKKSTVEALAELLNWTDQNADGKLIDDVCRQVRNEIFQAESVTLSRWHEWAKRFMSTAANIAPFER